MSDNIKKCLETAEDMMRLSSSILLNEKQCNNLVANLRNGVEAIQKIKKGSRSDVFCEVEQDLVRIVNKAKNVVDECCKEDWCQGAVLQIDNKETFRELLLDLECCFHTMCDISRMCYQGQSQSIIHTQNCTTFYPASIDEVEEDEYSLHKRLSKHLTMDTIEDRALAQYLLERVASLQLARGEELDRIVFPCDYPKSKAVGRFDSPLGTTCTTGCVVLPTKWEGMESATKVINVEDPKHKRILLKEASILGGLNHPNIIKFFCCGFFFEKFEKFELVMERGKLDLRNFLNQEKASMTDAVRMDIMLQIASGMCYLHDMKVAHRDLKPSNVVVTSMDASKSDGCLEYVHVKLVDFGISKIEVKESPQVPTGQFCFGTVHYMAPEAFENRKMKLYAFKTDVFSFAMTSFEILTGEKPFGEISRNHEYLKLIHDGKRPNLPKNCSEELKSLIHDCWSLDPSKRPTFLEICNTLRLLKSAKFKNVISMDEILHHSEPSWSYDLLMSPKQWWTHFMGIIYSVFLQIILYWQVFVTHSSWLLFMPKIGKYGSSPQDTRNAPSLHQILDKVNNTTIESKRLIGFEDQIPQLEGQLHKIGRLGIVGTDGIGKSTLANALSIHISHQFDGTCFVGDVKGETCTFIFKHKLEDMQEAPQVKKLIEARIKMEHICKTKNILIVVDDVSEHIDLHQLLGDQIFKDVTGSKLIASSRSRQSFGRYIPKAGIVNMKLLEGDKPMKLFCMHAFGTDQSCEPYLKHVAEKIVNACGGLPWNLEVTGKRMHGERRLRIWERTLHRMLKGRYDGLSKLIAFGKPSMPKCRALKHMPQGFGMLTCLKKLNMWEYEALEVFPSGLSNLIALEELNFFKYRALKHVPEGFGTLTCLRKLGMWECEALEVFPSGLNNLKALEELTFSQCRALIHVPEGFGNLTCLKKLDMSECEALEVFPSGLSRLIALEELNFSQCRALKHVPEGFETLTRLRKLDMSKCEGLEVFPSGLSKLIALEELDCSQCRALKHVPEGFETLTRLKKLDMSECEALEVFPFGLTKLTTLEELWSYQCPAFKHVSHGFGAFDILEKT